MRDHAPVTLDREFAVAAFGDEISSEELDDREYGTQEFDVARSCLHRPDVNASGLAGRRVVPPLRPASIGAGDRTGGESMLDVL